LGHTTPLHITSIFADAVKLIPVVYATTQSGARSRPHAGVLLVGQTIQANEWAEKNRPGIGLHLQELKRPQRRITNVANC
jgi:hypothetical protein